MREEDRVQTRINPIEALVPHKGAMCLWEEVISHSAHDVHVATRSHLDLTNPLRSDGMLKSIHLCEYGAQAMAVHGGLLAKSAGAARAGMLVALRGVQLHVPRIDVLPGVLEAHAELLMASDASQQYGFRIVHAGEVIAEGRAAVMLGAPSST